MHVCLVGVKAPEQKAPEQVFIKPYLCSSHGQGPYPIEDNEFGSQYLAM